MKASGVLLVLLTLTRGYAFQIPYQPLSPSDLYERREGKIVRASPEDLALARTYGSFSNKGPLKDGQRITILTAKNMYKVGEEVRVLHILEAVAPGITVWVMGPKGIYGEFIDSKLVSATEPGPTAYDGLMTQSPYADFNYDITKYTFTQPGKHTLQWKGGGHPFQGSLNLESNVIQLTIVN